jgi:Tfp pilus assembly protein PilO
MKNIVSGIAAVLAIALFFFYTKPAFDTVQSLQAQNAQYDAALAKATQLESLKQSLLAKYNSFDPNQLTRLSTMLPDQVDNIRLILDLDNIAQQYTMSLQNVQISEPAATGSGTNGTQPTTAIGQIASNQQPYDSVTLQFSTHGTYGQFKQFLSDLQSSLRIVDVVSMAVTPSGSGPSTSVKGDATSTADSYAYGYTMTLQTYWLPQ